METAGRNVPRATCLVRALAGQAFLARYGHETDLRIGVLKEQSEKRVKAHAWLESQGLVLLGGTVGSYTAFPTLRNLEFRKSYPIQISRYPRRVPTRHEHRG